MFHNLCDALMIFYLHACLDVVVEIETTEEAATEVLVDEVILVTFLSY